MEALTAAGLATLAGVSEAEVARMTDLGILVPRDGPAPFRVGDLQKIRLAVACERAGLPMDGIAAAVRAGRLSFAFLEAAPYHRFGVPTDRTYRQVSQETGISLEALRECLEAAGFAWTSPDDAVRDDELEVVPLIDLGLSSGVLDRRWMARVGRGYAEGMRLAAREAEGALSRPGRVPAMCFLDLAGYTRLTEEHGDQAAAELAETVAALVERMARVHRGTAVKWLGDGVMLHFPEPAEAVAAALEAVERLPAAGLPPAHVGVAAGPVVVQGGDYFGRTVNLAARLAARAQAGQVLATAPVAEAAADGVAWTELGELELKGFAAPVRVLAARRAVNRARGSAGPASTR